MTHFINKTKALLVAGTLALTFGFVGTAQAILIDFSSGRTGTYVGVNGFGPAYTSYSEDDMTVVSLVDHIHLPDVGGSHGTVLRNHSGDCCSTPYELTFDVAINLISFDYMADDQSSDFLTDAVGATLAGLVDTPGGNWFTVNVATQTNNPSDFLNIMEILWFQNSGTLKVDNLVYEKVDVAPIPEPSTMLLLGSGLAGIVGWRYRKQQA